MRNKLILLFVLLVSGIFVDSSFSQCCGESWTYPTYVTNYPTYTYSRGYVVEPTLHIYIKNIVGGREVDRFYVNAYLRKQKYRVQLPVINGFLPNVTVYDNGNHIYALVLDYKSKTEFNHKLYFDETGYVNYSLPVNKSKVDEAIKAVKTPDEAVKTDLNNSVPSAVKPDSDLVFPNKTNTTPPKEEKSFNSGAVRLPTDKEIDELFNKK